MVDDFVVFEFKVAVATCWTSLLVSFVDPDKIKNLLDEKATERACNCK